MGEEVREECGVFGCYGHSDAAVITQKGLFQIQHRGQESVGIATGDGHRCHARRRVGLVSEQMAPEDCASLKGHISTGHVRYSTAGGSDVRNIQPLSAEIKKQIVYVSENGNFVNYLKLREQLESAGAIFQTTTDAELVHHLIARSKEQRLEDKIVDTCNQIRGAYSLLLMTEDTLFAVRDPRGFKPLCLGKKDDAHFLASETVAFDINGIEYVRDIEPAEMVVFNRHTYKTKKGYESKMITRDIPDITQCIFELVYFRRPDSLVLPNSHLTVGNLRFRMGQRLYREHPVKVDVLGAVPDSGNSVTKGIAFESGLMLDDVFVRNHYVGRTFISPENEKRADGVDIKLGVNRGAVYGRRVGIGDDSIVRGTTSRRKIMQLRDAGAREVHMFISCPPVMHPCFYGMDFPTYKELAANNVLDKNGRVDTKRFAHYIGADSVNFLSQSGLLWSCAPMKTRFCLACYDGKYPVSVNA
jgi:amidophosphoribosyltransferase